MRQKPILIIVALALLMFAYQNCADTVGFSKIEKASGLEGPVESSELPQDSNEETNLNDGESDNNEVPPNDSEDPPIVIEEPSDDDNIEEVVYNCETLAPKIILEKIEFPAYEGCEYGKNGNLSRLNMYVQARVEHKRNLVLPPNAILCDIDMATEKSSMYYDDHLLLTLNKFLLATSNTNYILDNLLLKVPNTNMQEPLYKYDWNNMVGAKWTTDRMHNIPYCIGSKSGDSACEIPQTERTGSFIVDIGAKQIQSIIGLSTKSNVYEFQLVVTGDNDNDCRSSAFSFDISATYVVPPIK